MLLHEEWVWTVAAGHEAWMLSWCSKILRIPCKHTNTREWLRATWMLMMRCMTVMRVLLWTDQTR